MAIITESELEVRLNHTNNAAKGRTAGAQNLPDALRAVIGFQAHFETAKNVAEEFGVAPITAHEAKESHGHPEAQEAIQRQLGEVRDLAITKMLTAMGVISTEKIQKLKVTGALRVINGMATVLEKTVEKGQQVSTNQVIIYAPQVKESSDYSFIDVEKAGG